MDSSHEGVTARKPDRIYETTVFRHWTTGSTELNSWEDWNKWGKPYDCLNLLLGGSFQATAQRRRNSEDGSHIESKGRDQYSGRPRWLDLVGQHTWEEGAAHLGGEGSTPGRRGQHTWEEGAAQRSPRVRLSSDLCDSRLPKVGKRSTRKQLV